VSATFTNPVLNGTDADHGDPFVIRYLESFYLYHTGETSGRRGISVHRSDDLVHWEFQGFALEASETGWAYSDLWAPEVVYERGTFYMYVSAAPRLAGEPSSRWQQGQGDDMSRRIGVARSSTPLGPFVLDEQPLLDEWSIDAHPFRDDDGTMWLFYNVRSDETRVDTAQGTGTVCDRLVAMDRLEGKPTQVTYPSQDWEGPYRDWYWNEGPYVLKRRGIYYQLYSGGFYNDSSYAIGVAEARSPRGPWTKYDGNPIMRSGERIQGPGHNSFVYGPDAATRYAVYHGYVAGETGRKIHLDRQLWRGDGPRIAGPTETPQPTPPVAVFDAAIPHWRADVWAKGSWVQVGGRRFPLAPTDVWQQVEAIQADERIAVRIGGVLVSSHPAHAADEVPFFATDGDLTAQTTTSYLEDGELHELPARSSFAWRWGGGGALELTLAIKGEAELELDGDTRAIGWDDKEFRLVGLQHAGDVEEIAVHTGGTGAVVTDLSVYARL
jgi:GH43 family beta-xylosidase